MVLGISDTVMARVDEDLARCETSEDVAVCLAVESGSRAWGFPSVDSDYDVRFLYVRRPEWYLTIYLEERRDVIERPLADRIDLSGWDLRKALRLFRKSNPPLMEWLQCPLVYRERFSAAARLRVVVKKAAGAELDRGPRIEAISEFIESEMERCEAAAGAAETSASSLEALNDLFREVLNEVWAPRQPA